MSALKEPRFFMLGDLPEAEIRNKSIPIQTLEGYAALFQQAGDALVLGEASSNYLNSPLAARKIHDLVPDAKLLASLRNPVDRAIAHHEMVAQATGVDTPILETDNARWLKSSCYFDKLKHYYKMFPASQIKILIFEEWIADVPSTLSSVYGFLGVDGSYELDSGIGYTPAVVFSKRFQRANWYRKLRPLVSPRLAYAIKTARSKLIGPKSDSVSAENRAELREFFEQDILKLQELIDRDLSSWLR